MKKHIVTIGIISLVGAAILVGVLVWGIRYQPAEKEIVCTDELDTRCWKTYRNEEYGFEFKYPGEWYIDYCQGELDGLIAIMSDQYVNCFVNVNESKISAVVQDDYDFNRQESRLKNYKRENIPNNYIKISGILNYEDADGNIIPDQWIKITDTIIFNSELEGYIILKLHRGYGVGGINLLKKDITIYNVLIESFKFI